MDTVLVTDSAGSTVLAQAANADGFVPRLPAETLLGMNGIVESAEQDAVDVLICMASIGLTCKRVGL